MTAGQVAAELGVTPRHVWHLYKVGRLPGEKISNRMIVFREQDVTAYRDKPDKPKPGRPRAPRPAREGDGDAGVR